MPCFQRCAGSLPVGAVTNYGARKRSRAVRNESYRVVRPCALRHCAVFTLLCARLNLHSYRVTLKLALAVWFVGPLPLLIVNGLFIKLHSAITVAYSLGWLVKLMLPAVAVTLILR